MVVGPLKLCFIGLCGAVVTEALLRGVPGKKGHKHGKKHGKKHSSEDAPNATVVMPAAQPPRAMCSERLPRNTVNAASEHDADTWLASIYNRHQDKAFNISQVDKASISAAATRMGKVPQIECSEDSYGEISQESAAKLFSHPLIHMQAGETFGDLGSGLGQLVVDAVLVGNAKRAVGIELSSDRYSESCSALSEIKNQMPESKQTGWRADRHTGLVELREGDIMETQDAMLKELNVVYLANLCFRNDLLAAVMQKLNHALPAGARIASLRQIETNKKETSRLKSRGSLSLPMSWSFPGYSQAIYVYEVQ